jgi:hypothetical protein
VFKRVDVNNDGAITSDEIIVALRKVCRIAHTLVYGVLRGTTRSAKLSRCASTRGWATSSAYAGRPPRRRRSRQVRTRSANASVGVCLIVEDTTAVCVNTAWRARPHVPGHGHRRRPQDRPPGVRRLLRQVLPPPARVGADGRRRRGLRRGVRGARGQRVGLHMPPPQTALLGNRHQPCSRECPNPTDPVRSRVRRRPRTSRWPSR